MVMQMEMSKEDPPREVYMFMKAKCLIVITKFGNMQLVSSDKGIVPINVHYESIPTKVLTF
jgi:hypothetical protein